jgi:uncharacterized protein (DUF2236 family)
VRPQLSEGQLPEGERVDAPLGPDSMLWQCAGQQSGFLMGLYAGSMQNMHPQLGAGVEEHSDFFTERWQRLMRSIYPINGGIFDGDRAQQTAHEIRDYHLTIKGVDKHGRPYSALNPDTWWWAHATFVMSAYLHRTYFIGKPFTPAEREQFYQDTLVWYRSYGVSTRPCLPDWASFEAYYQRMCVEELEDNYATRAVLDLSGLPQFPGYEWIPDPVWAVLRKGINVSFVWITVGLYPQSIRDKLGYRWTRRDELAFRAFSRGIAVTKRVIPRELQLHPRARTAWARATGKLPADAPLVHTPRKFLPPVEARANGMHYCPYT